MAKADYYDVLGVQKGVDEATIKGAYRKLAMQFHPDRNPGNADAEHRYN
jgi:molecular chaperone DnaJ